MLPGCVWDVLRLYATCRRKQCYAEISYPSYLVTNRGAAVVHFRICFVETASQPEEERVRQRREFAPLAHRRLTLHSRVRCGGEI